MSTEFSDRASDVGAGSRLAVVIIGGGIWGCSIAYHLSRAGLRDVAVFEMSELATGNTSNAAGLVGQLRSSAFMGRAIGGVVGQLQRFQKETGQDPGFRQVGSLKVALTEGRVRELKEQVRLARSWGLEVELISPGEAQRKVPLLETKNVKAVAWVPTDGYVDPYTLAIAYAKAAREYGVQFRTQRPVSAVKIDDGRATGVVAGDEEVRAEHVVVAAGPWGELIAERLGLVLPTIPIRHQLWVTAPMDGVPRTMPVVRLPDANSYIRPEVGGILMGGFESTPRSYAMADLPPTFQMDQLPEDREPLLELGSKLAETFPALDRAPLIGGARGLPTFTPDGEYLIGEAPGIRHLWVVTGCNAIGIAGSMLIGRWLTELIMEGRASDDLSSMSLTRFGSRYGDRRLLVRECESIYANFYSLEKGAF